MINLIESLKELNIVLPKATKPVANYSAYVIVNNKIYISGQIPIKNGNYPCYVHTYPDKSDDEYDFNYVKIVVEGIEGCYLSRDQKGKLVFNKRQKESSFIKEHIKNKSKTISLDQIVLRN